MLFCIVLSIIGTIYPIEIYAGTFANNLGYAYFLLSLIATMILVAVYLFVFKPDRNIMMNFSPVETIFFWITVIYSFYRGFQFKTGLENGLSTTSSTLMGMLAIFLQMNFDIWVAINNLSQK
jgi:hypothetical protein